MFNFLKGFKRKTTNDDEEIQIIDIEDPLEIKPSKDPKLTPEANPIQIEPPKIPKEVPKVANPLQIEPPTKPKEVPKETNPLQIEPPTKPKEVPKEMINPSQIEPPKKPKEVPKEILHMCDNCDFSTNYENHLNNHLQKKICLRVYKCSDCTEAFSKKDELIKHMRSIHKKIRSYHEFKCPNCEFSALGKGSLTKHLQLGCLRVQNEKDGLKEENIKKIVVSQGFNKIEKIKLRESNN